MVRVTRLERATSCSQSRRATPAQHPGMKFFVRVRLCSQSRRAADSTIIPDFLALCKRVWYDTREKQMRWTLCGCERRKICSHGWMPAGRCWCGTHRRNGAAGGSESRVPSVSGWSWAAARAVSRPRPPPRTRSTATYRSSGCATPWSSPWSGAGRWAMIRSY